MFVSSSWYKLDNSGKLFPAVADSINSSVFRMSVVLKEEVNPFQLQKASNELFEVYPMYMVGLKMGLFWYYLNPLKDPIKVEEEVNFPSAPFDFKESDKLMRILYYKNRISVEVFHSLTDGFGGMEFLKSLLYFYLKQSKDIDDEGLIRLHTEFTDEDFEDSYVKHAKKGFHPKKKLPPSLLLEGTPFKNPGNNLIFGRLKADQILSISRSHNTTITTFLTAVLIHAIALSSENPKERPIVVSVPINLRKHFESKTLSNFFGVANIGVIADKKTSFDEILELCKEQFEIEMNPLMLQETINSNVAFQNYPGIKFVPTAIKNRVINIGAMVIGERTKTLTLSNLGIVRIPESMSKEIETFEAVLYPTSKSPMISGMITYNNIMTLSFISRIQETDVIKTFFKLLANDFDCHTEIYSNDWGEDYETL